MTNDYKSLRRAFLGVVVLVLGAGAVQASTITYYANIWDTGATITAGTSPLGPYTLSESPYTATVTVAKFDPTLGGTLAADQHAVLKSVGVLLTWWELTTIDVVNKDRTKAHTYENAYASIPVAITGLGISTSGTATSGMFAGTVGPATATAYGEDTQPGSVVSGFSTETITSGLAAYVAAGGTSTYALQFATGDGTYSGTQTDGSGKLLFGGSAGIGAQLALTYNYEIETVPEPATLLLIGGALCGLAVLRRRRVQ
jgi:hypothetical protein